MTSSGRPDSANTSAVRLDTYGAIPARDASSKAMSLLLPSFPRGSDDKSGPAAAVRSRGRSPSARQAGEPALLAAAFPTSARSEGAGGGDDERIRKDFAVRKGSVAPRQHLAARLGDHDGVLELRG